MRVRAAVLGVAVYLSLGFALVSASRGQSDTNTQTGSASQQQPNQLIHSLDGPDLFRAYCASCHGADAKGHGPAAVALKSAVPDLTVLARDNGGQFPSARVRSRISGESLPASHGSLQMPVWGPVFHQVESDVDRGYVRLENLVKYLESIQSVNPSPDQPLQKSSAESSPSGAQLYARHCAACHGNDLKGGGPAPYPFKEVTPDLTTLAQRHGGKYPADYVSDVLQNGVVMPAHGPSEMPTWGTDFKAGKGMNEAQVKSRISSLNNYIKSHQIK